MTSVTITYGRRGGPRSGHIREGRRGVANPSFSVRADETPPLRLNSDIGLRFTPELLSTVATNDQKLTYLRHEIAGALDQFAIYQRRFLDHYFTFIGDRCADAAAALQSSLAWSGGLLRAEDYVFSALWPLPDCSLDLSNDSAVQTIGSCDFAFWSGRQAIAVTLTGSPNQESNTTAVHGMVIPVTVTAAELNMGSDLFSEPRFPPEFVTFWQSEPVPSSPFRPVGLTTPAAGES